MSKYTVVIQDENGNALNSISVENTLDEINRAVKALDKGMVGEVPKFQMTYVGNRSSNVESVGWLNESLYVKFQHNTTLYRYDGVPREIYEGVMSADSVGKYLVANVKDKYSVVKVN